MEQTIENTKAFVKVDEVTKRIIITYETLHPITKKEIPTIFSMNIEHAGKLLELLTECIRRIHELHDEELSARGQKVYEPKAGRTNA